MRGYTLLELLVVLAIIGLLTAMVVPALNKTYEAWRWRTIQDDVVFHIQLLSQSAYTDGKGTTVDHQAFLGELPEDVVVSFQPELRINNKGVCLGSELTIRWESRRQTLNLVAPFCEVDG